MREATTRVFCSNESQVYCPLPSGNIRRTTASPPWKNLQSFVVATIHRFQSSRLSAPNRGDSSSVPEAQYRSELYRAVCDIGGRGLFISPEYVVSSGSGGGSKDFLSPTIGHVGDRGPQGCGSHTRASTTVFTNGQV